MSNGLLSLIRLGKTLVPAVSQKALPRHPLPTASQEPASSLHWPLANLETVLWLLPGGLGQIQRADAEAASSYAPRPKVSPNGTGVSEAVLSQ